ncbi:MAG: LysR family transcriptional regulator [Rhodanobacter denitrificans]|uniref:LysR family transcriptional regulator n=1 Tax=Rhodanobacter denitrificans TaxID=666685 RepID=A0A2W5KQQ9_9GAMM|nr:MAG: LysR family transcriptional regulator [Rhodanobacter denitrificans]
MHKAGLVELNAVAAVAAHRSFRRAARALGMSPSALSHAVAALEQRMGVRLFNRTTRAVAPSAAGEQFLARVRPALREIALAMQEVDAQRQTPSGVLRINTSVGAAEQIMTPVVVEFVRRHPAMQVHLVTDSALVDIVADGYDAGIRLAESVPQDMIAVPCGPPVRFAVVASPAYFATRPRPRVPADLAEHDCIRIRFASGTIYRWEFEQRGRVQTVDVTGPLTLDNHTLMIEAALQGVGLAWSSEFAVAQHLAAGRLIRVLEDWTPAYPGLCVFYPANRHVPASLRAFVELIREWTG